MLKLSHCCVWKVYRGINWWKYAPIKWPDINFEQKYHNNGTSNLVIPVCFLGAAGCLSRGSVRMKNSPKALVTNHLNGTTISKSKAQTVAAIIKRSCRKVLSGLLTFKCFPHIEIGVDGCLLGCCAVCSGRSLPTFHRCLVPSSSGRCVTYSPE
jgi:hypothetical protein